MGECAALIRNIAVTPKKHSTYCTPTYKSWLNTKPGALLATSPQTQRSADRNLRWDATTRSNMLQGSAAGGLGTSCSCMLLKGSSRTKQPLSRKWNAELTAVDLWPPSSPTASETSKGKFLFNFNSLKYHFSSFFHNATLEFLCYFLTYWWAGGGGWVAAVTVLGPTAGSPVWALSSLPQRPTGDRVGLCGLNDVWVCF